MASSTIRKLCLLFLYTLFFIIPSSFAQEARLKNIIVTNTRDDLLLYMTVQGAFREKTKKAILSGVPVTFSFIIPLYQTRNLWFDKKITETKISHTIKYNNLKKEFIVKRSWEKNKPLLTTSFEEARKLMTEIDSLKVISLSRLKKGREYQIRAKAELSKLTLPFYLHYVLIFVSLWDFETDWYTIDFTY